MHTTPTVESLRAPLRRGALRVVSAALLLLVTVGGGPASARQTGPDHSGLHAAYHASIQDSAVYRFSNLRPLRPLKFDPKTGTATVVQLTDFRGYSLGENTLKKEVWVTGVPEVQERCRGFSTDLEMRLRQLLGLPPDQQIVHFVVMNVKESDIFRPAAYRDTKTTLPCSCPVPVNCGQVFPDKPPAEHVNWFAMQMVTKYAIAEVPATQRSERSGYPWTRLGYTYDWKPGADKYGASEYVIPEEATVTVTDIVPYQKYCGFPE